VPELHDYQVLARDYLRANDRAGLFLDMGLGKTAATLRALEPRHLPVLVSAPKRVAMEVWPAEVKIWRPDLTIQVVGTKDGNADERAALLKNATADIVVMGRDLFHETVPHAKRYRTLVIDELSGYKSKTSQRWKTANRLQKVIPRLWGLTGTPSPNGLLDLWGPLYLLDQGQRLGTTIGGYRGRYFTSQKTIFVNGRQVPVDYRPNPGAEARIHHLISDICLGMKTDGRIKLPEFTVNRVNVPLDAKAAKPYRDMERDFVAALELLGTVHSAKNAAILTSRLSQITAGFLYNDDQDINPGHSWIHDGKVEALKEIVEATDGPLLVFYRYQAELKRLLEKFPHATDVKREHDLQNRWNAGEIPLLLAHPASAGHGLNLQSGEGHTMAWTTLPTNLEEWDQANKRLHRQGQKKAVVCHVLHSPATVDVVDWARLVDKKSVQDALMDYLEAPFL
jgi:hypothetical protein